MSDLKLYSAWYCPFAQRAWMALLHKGLEFDYAEIDPYLKTPEWMTNSRGTGQVPVLVENVDKKNEIIIPGSTRILEYIDTRFSSDGPLLFPTRPQAQADAKFWIDYQGSHIIPYFYRFLKAEATSDAADIAKHELEQGLENFANAMAAAGPYFSGSEVNAIDIAFAPFALRIDLLLTRYKQYVLPREGSNWERYHQWWNAMSGFGTLIESTKGVSDYKEQLINFYVPYAQGGGQKDVTKVT